MSNDLYHVVMICFHVMSPEHRQKTHDFFTYFLALLRKVVQNFSRKPVTCCIILLWHHNNYRTVTLSSLPWQTGLLWACRACEPDHPDRPSACQFELFVVSLHLPWSPALPIVRCYLCYCYRPGLAGTTAGQPNTKDRVREINGRAATDWNYPDSKSQAINLVTECI